MSARSSSPNSPGSSHHGSPPSGELKHLTSNSALGSTRTSQMLSPSNLSRLGSMSPSEIPSSPTSIHSTSSAIFERDIEPVGSPSSATAHHPSHVTNPRFIPRGKASEPIDQSVPSVLDSAAEVLATVQPTDPESAVEVAVVSPAASMHEGRSSRSGFTSPIGSFRSRSPSPAPLGAGPGPQHRPSLLLAQQSNSPTPIATVPPHVRPIVNTDTTNPAQQHRSPSQPPSIVTPTSAYFSPSSATDDNSESPLTTTMEQPPSSLATSAGSPISSTNLSHPPSPTHVARKRLSFMSYKDLVASTPASTQLLSTLTTSATADPPSHIPSVTGLSSAHASDAGSVRGFHGGSMKERNSIIDDIEGGEWQREGLGQGLEERLEALMPIAAGGKA